MNDDEIINLETYILLNKLGSTSGFCQEGYSLI